MATKDYINKVTCGDCLELMKDLDDESVDLVVTDPPYGLEFRDNEWDKEIPDWIDEAKRISKIIIFTTAPLTIYDYPKPDWILCWYRPASNSRSLLGGFNHWSPIMVYGKPKFKVDSINLHAIANATYVNHPSPKPLKLFSWIIKVASEENDLILDPFGGSGTVAVACKQLNRNSITFEINPEYCKIAERRLAQTVMSDFTSQKLENGD